MSTITSLTSATTIDPVADYLAIDTASLSSTQKINRNTLLSLASAPVGLTDTQTLTNKTLTSPTINGATLSGTLSGTYTIGGTPTFPSTVVQTTSTQTLTNKTLTSPSITSPTITNATLSADAITGYTTSNAGTIYGLSISGGTISGTNITSNSITATQIASGTITNTQIASAGLYTSKVYNPYKFMIYRTSAYTTVATTETRMPFDTKLFDTGSNADVTSNQGRFTAPVSGYYQFNAVINIAAATSSRFFLSLSKNGNEYIRGSDVNYSSLNIYVASVSGLIPLNASDYVELFYYAGTASSIVTGSTTNQQTSFSGYLVSAT